MASKYLVVNQTPYAIQLLIPGPGDRGSVSMTIDPMGALDVLPWAGSIDGCKRIAFIRDLEYRGIVRVEQE